jgi:hypothetical protein
VISARRILLVGADEPAAEAGPRLRPIRLLLLTHLTSELVIS